MAKFKTVVDSLEGVPEALHEYYVEKDGKFEAQLEGGKTQGDVDRVSAALTKERKEHKDTKEKVKAWGDLDPEETLRILDEVPELKQQLETSGGKKTDEEVESIVKGRLGPIERLLEKANADLLERNNEVAGFKSANEGRLIMDALRKVATASEADKMSYATDKSGLLQSTVGLFEIVDGRVVAREDSGLTMGHTPSEALEDIQSLHPYYWKSPNGGGSNPSSGHAGAKSVFSKNNMTERAELYRSDRAEYDRQFKASGLPHQHSKVPEK